VRVLLTWELGLNLGHLTRLLPVAQELRRQGHTVLVASRDIQTAAIVLGPSGIPFIQAPHLPKGIPLEHRATGYADILMSQGWSDQSALWALTHAWLNIVQLFRPDKLVLDYSPTVSLAAWIARIPTVLVGNGFELPPLTEPLPAFPGFSWATQEKAAKSEMCAVANTNGVLRAFKRTAINALSDLVINDRRLCASFSEFDHYGERDDVEYVGPLFGQLSAPNVDWPKGHGPRLFACLRPDTSHVKEILIALAAMSARVVCVASGFTKSQLEPFRMRHIKYTLGPVQLQPLLNADLCITYGSEGTMMRFLTNGVPLLISPWHVEAFMAARKLETNYLGLTYRGDVAGRSIRADLDTLIQSIPIRERVTAFAARAVASSIRGAAAAVVDALQAPEQECVTR
jgi:hypothetical protein